MSKLSVCALFALAPLPARALEVPQPGTYVAVVSDVGQVEALSALATVRGPVPAPDEIAAWSLGDRAVVPSRIYGLTVRDDEVRIVSELLLTDGGRSVSYDLEGLDVDTHGGWWVVAEGEGNGTTPNRLLHVDGTGEITEDVRLPPAVDVQQRWLGFEGVCTSDDGAQVYVAFQGPWGDDPAGFVRLGRYTPATGEWAFYHYPVDPGPGDVGPSELTWAGGGTLLVLERDDLDAAVAVTKRLYTISVNGVTPAPAGTSPPILGKTLLRDLLADDAWPHKKAEGVAIHGRDLVVVNDNDGRGGPTQALLLRSLAP